MSNTPSDAEIEKLAKRHGATSYRNRADTQHPAYGFTEDGLNGLIDEVLAKWGSPQPATADAVDAERYRWLRNNWFTMTSNYQRCITFKTGEPRWSDITEQQLDAAIDAAIAAQKGTP